jgi:hypothetical protein
VELWQQNTHNDNSSTSRDTLIFSLNHLFFLHYNIVVGWYTPFIGLSTLSIARFIYPFNSFHLYRLSPFFFTAVCFSNNIPISSVMDNVKCFFVSSVVCKGLLCDGSDKLRLCLWVGDSGCEKQSCLDCIVVERSSPGRTNAIHAVIKNCRSWYFFMSGPFSFYFSIILHSLCFVYI